MHVEYLFCLISKLGSSFYLPLIVRLLATSESTRLNIGLMALWINIRPN